MNYRGSYRRLLGNSKAAMIAAIEVYNKPSFEYRDECSVILLINSWELVLKAVISKAGRSIFYRKERNRPYRTISWSTAFTRAQEFAPNELLLPVHENLKLLSEYRDHAIHFYNAKDFGVLIHSLAQTAVLNYHNLVSEAFGLDLSEAINWPVLPIGTSPSIDVASYISGKSDAKTSSAVREFLSVLTKSVRAVEEASLDTSKLMTVFDVNLQSTKKVTQADIVVGVDGGKEREVPLAIVRNQDPNVTHPLRQRDIVEAIKKRDEEFTKYTFQAIAWKFKIKDNPRLCWKAKEGVLVRYSNETKVFIRQLPRPQIVSAINAYRKHLRRPRSR